MMPIVIDQEVEYVLTLFSSTRDIKQHILNILIHFQPHIVLLSDCFLDILWVYNKQDALYKARGAYLLRQCVLSMHC